MTDPKYKQIGKVETRVMEECSELIQILCKVERFGYDNWHPKDGTKTSNKTLVLRELSDVEDVIRELREKLGE